MIVNLYVIKCKTKALSIYFFTCKAQNTQTNLKKNCYQYVVKVFSNIK